MPAVLDPQRWARLRPLLDHALDLDPKARDDFVHSLSGEDPDLAGDLLRLLKLNSDEPSALGQPAAAMVADTALLGTDTGTAPRAAPWLGKRVGAFELRALLGTGGMGAVYAGERVAGGFRQKVAIKLISGLHPGLMQRFAHERQILADLRHPHIAALLDGGETTDGLPFFAMEFIEGQNLFEHCQSIAADLDTRLDLLIDVAEALAYAHARKLIHRDIKPGNILVSRSGEVKLLDFGIAKLLDATAPQPTLTQQTVGPMTPAYAAPEQFRGEALSAATDIYQFGVLAFRLFSGRSPYRATGDAALELARAVSDEQPLSLTGALRLMAEQDSRLRPQLDHSGTRWRDLDLVLARCLAKQPRDRYPDMASLIADLRAVRAAKAPQVRASAIRQRWRRQGLRASLAVLVLAALLLGGWWWWRGEADPWMQDPALYAMGLDRSHLHHSTPEGEAMLRQALRREAAGDLAGARTLLEAAHAADPQTPVPAMMLAYWGSTEVITQQWQAEVEKRLPPLKDVQLNLFWQFIRADSGDEIEDALRYAAALLEFKPQAWYLRLSRAHLLSVRGLRDAGLAELKQIDARQLGHRKLSDAIADRASFGDLAGARLVAASLHTAADDPDFAMLSARLAFSGGDARAALGQFAEAVRRAQSQARFDIEGRGLLYQGALHAVLGELDAAIDRTSAARARFVERRQWSFALDAALVIAQVEALRQRPEALRAALADARRWAEQGRPGQIDPLLELVAARLLRQSPAPLGETHPGVESFAEARRAWHAGQRDSALLALERAQSDGILQTSLSEEYRLLMLELGQDPGPLPALDPPFPPYIRFVTRVAMGRADSVVPPTVPTPQ